MANTKKLYNINDSVTGRDGGPYLDEVQAREAEVRRAAIEGREPSEELQSYAGIQLVPAATLLQTATTNNLPSQNNNSDLAAAFDESKLGAQAVAEYSDDEPDAKPDTSGNGNNGGRR